MKREFKDGTDGIDNGYDGNAHFNTSIAQNSCKEESNNKREWLDIHNADQRFSKYIFYISSIL